MSHGAFLQGSPGAQGMVGPQGDPGDEVILNCTRNNGKWLPDSRPVRTSFVIESAKYKHLHICWHLIFIRNVCNLPDTLKCLYGQQGFIVMVPLYCVKRYSKKKIGFWDFNALKSGLKVPASATPNEFDRVMIDWWRMTSLQEYLKALCFYFACLTTALLCRLQFVCFLSR